MVRSSAVRSTAQFMKRGPLRDELLFPAKPCLVLIADGPLAGWDVLLSDSIRVESMWTVLEA